MTLCAGNAEVNVRSIPGENYVIVPIACIATRRVRVAMQQQLLGTAREMRKK
jgi:hypothetical protein